MDAVIEMANDFEVEENLLLSAWMSYTTILGLKISDQIK